MTCSFDAEQHFASILDFQKLHRNSLFYECILSVCRYNEELRQEIKKLSGDLHNQKQAAKVVKKETGLQVDVDDLQLYINRKLSLVCYPRPVLSITMSSWYISLLLKRFKVTDTNTCRGTEVTFLRGVKGNKNFGKLGF